jgi:hypothetical protein
MPGNPNPVPNSTWTPGVSGNPNGRPRGSRNIRTTEIVNQIIKSGNKDPLVTLSELQANSADEAIRATAANMLAPFLHSKLTATPAPRFIETEITLPPLDSLENAVQSIAIIEAAVAENRLDVQSANDLIGMINAFIAGKNVMEIAELQERLTAIESAIAASPASAQVVHVEGGMPPLPGTDVIMPQINGTNIKQLQSLPGEPVVPIEQQGPSVIDSVPQPDIPDVPTKTPYYRS